MSLKTLHLINSTPILSPISLMILAYNLPKPPPMAYIGANIPLGIGHVIERIIKKNLQMQYTIRLKVVFGLDHMCPKH